MKKIELGDIDRFGRYVLLKVVPQGSFIFCDEIEVLKSGYKTIRSSQIDLITIDSLNSYADVLQSPKQNRRILIRSIDRLINVSNTYKLGIETRSKLLEVRSKLNNNLISMSSLSTMKEQIGQENASALKNRFNLPYLVEKHNPWDSLERFRGPNVNSDSLSYQFFTMRGSVEYGSFIITNCDIYSKKFSFQIIKNTVTDNIEIYKVPFVPSSYYFMIPDPMKIIKDSVSIDPGVSEMFIFKITGMHEGSGNSIIQISSTEKITKINISTRVLSSFNSSDLPNLNVNIWAYFNRSMIKGHEKEVEEDLQSHHVNTMVIPPHFIPDMETSDYSNLISYLANFKGAKNILLFMDYSSTIRRIGYKGGKFMSTEWKNNFVLWYNKIIKLIHENCSLSAQIYLYP